MSTIFVGNYYEKTGSTITEYYYAGAMRIAMRTGNTLTYLLGDHLGSTSITTDSNGALLMETRYKPFAPSAAPSHSLRSGSGSQLQGAHLPLGRAGFAREVRYTWKDVTLTTPSALRAASRSPKCDREAFPNYRLATLSPLGAAIPTGSTTRVGVGSIQPRR